MIWQNLNSTTRILNRLGDGHSQMVYCPVHEDNSPDRYGSNGHRPSLHVTPGSDGKVLFKCHAGCSQKAVIGALKTLGLCEQLSTSRPRRDIKRPPPDDEAYVKFCKTARPVLRAGMGCHGPYRQWHRQRRNPREKLLPYLQGRGLDKVPESALYLFGGESAQLTNFRFPAMVFPIIGPNGLQGAHVTFLTKDGAKNAREDGNNLRRMYGPAKFGYVQLGVIDRNKPLIVAEGIETALSARQITGLPAIAALSANNMKVITPPLSSEVIVVPDNDESGVGQAAAKELAQRLTNSGRRVRIVKLERPEGRRNWDCNDELKRAREQGADLTVLRKKMLASAEFERVGDISELVRPLGMEEFNQLVFPNTRTPVEAVADDDRAGDDRRATGARQDVAGAVDRVCRSVRQIIVGMAGGACRACSLRGR